MFTEKNIQEIQNLPTPFYYYDLGVLKKTLSAVVNETKEHGFLVHYALKANANEPILSFIKDYGLGADCVSGNEVKKAIEVGFNPNHVVFAGVGKSDEEINYALSANIFCFNCESEQEIEVINALALKQNKKANIAIRINPNVDANTHHYITTGLEENKFGISTKQLPLLIDKLKNLKGIYLQGIHFHIGSQITDLSAYKSLCVKVNEINQWLASHHIDIKEINVGGGLGIDYHHPDEKAIPDFKSYFSIFKRFLNIKSNQRVHFELGRSIVAQCGSLLSKVLYVKKGENVTFLILDAGMTELIRPALYHAYHKIENISRLKYPKTNTYDVVGPICESSDCFGKKVELPETERGNLIAIRSAGAYGEVMASNYNLREKVKAYYQ